MTALQVRDFPQELYGQLRERAHAEHRSISQQTIVAIEAYLNGRYGLPALVSEEDEQQKRISKRMAVFERLHALPRIEVSEGFPSPEEIVREMRDAR